MKIGIIGGGLSGLSLAYNLVNSRKYNNDVCNENSITIFEADEKVGGLLKSENLNGWVFDTGGSHIIFSKNEKTIKKMVDVVGNVIRHHRNTYIHYNNSFIKYPFENGIYMLNSEERYQILYNFVQNLLKRERNELKTPNNLLDWFYYIFGEKITEKYLKPYNEKLWKRDLKEISLNWVGNRIPNPPIEDILKSCVGIETEGYKHQIKFYYPLKGGIEALIGGILNKLRQHQVNLITKEKIKKIRLEDGKRILKGKKEYEFDLVISTAPLNESIKFLDSENVNSKLNSKFNIKSANLDYNSLTVVGLGCKGKVPDFHWVYVPDNDIIFHRIAFLNNYSPYMCPDDENKKCNILVEISHKPSEKVKNAVDKSIEGIEKLGIDVEVEVSKVWEWKYAYIVYNLQYAEKVKELSNFLTENGVIPFGRFGKWEYLNMDVIWDKSTELAEKLLNL